MMGNEICLNPIALRKAKIVYNFGLSEYNRVNEEVNIFPELFSNLISITMVTSETLITTSSPGNSKGYPIQT